MLGPMFLIKTQHGWVSRDLQETNEDSLWGVQTKVPRFFESRMSQVSKRKMPDNEYISENSLPTIYSNIETPEQTVVPRDLTKTSKNSPWNIPKRAARNFQPQQASQVEIGSRYEVLGSLRNHDGNGDCNAKLLCFRTLDSKDSLYFVRICFP